MAIDKYITGLETGSAATWEGYKGSRVREFLQKKIGYFYRTGIQSDNQYHLYGFASKEACDAWLQSPTNNKGLILVDTPLGKNIGESMSGTINTENVFDTDYNGSQADYNKYLKTQISNPENISTIALEDIEEGNLSNPRYY